MLAASNGDVVIVEGSRTGTVVENVTAGTQLPLPHLGAIDATAVRGMDLLLAADDTQNSSAFEQALRIDLSTMRIVQQSALPVQPANRAADEDLSLIVQVCASCAEAANLRLRVGLLPDDVPFYGEPDLRHE
ncbi:MAG: hypothetical protein ACREFT_12740 [Acetobacteraceae bacterium]